MGAASTSFGLRPQELEAAPTARGRCKVIVVIIVLFFVSKRLPTSGYAFRNVRKNPAAAKRAGMLHGQVTESIRSDKRPLLTPDEVMALPGPKKNERGDACLTLWPSVAVRCALPGIATLPLAAS